MLKPARALKTVQYKNILITGGAGFVGSHLAMNLKEMFPHASVISFDNLHRRGSELNIPRLKKGGVQFLHGDIRNKEDVQEVVKADLIIDCVAEPSVLAGVRSSPEYLLRTNLWGTVNALELAWSRHADFIFLSTSRVYPLKELRALALKERATRFVLRSRQKIAGVSSAGITEDFPLGTSRTLYGATKLASEILVQEYAAAFNIRAIINRFGVIAGPWQFGKVDQGVAALWVARHAYKSGALSYIGYGGSGKQVRDFLHIKDMCAAIMAEIKLFSRLSGGIFNIGGGAKNSLSLLEMTRLCQEVTGNRIKVASVPRERVGDIPLYITDHAKFTSLTGWKPAKSVREIFCDTHEWIINSREELRGIVQ